MYGLTNLNTRGVVQMDDTDNEALENARRGRKPITQEEWDRLSYGAKQDAFHDRYLVEKPSEQ